MPSFSSLLVVHHEQSCYPILIGKILLFCCVSNSLLQLFFIKTPLLFSQASEESEKMDEDSKIIEELRETSEHQRVQISRLEQALKQAIRDQDEIKMSNNNELKNAKEIIDELNRKLMSCKSTINAKNMEVLNLQTALGQYYAEIEAKVMFLISSCQ